MKSKFIIFILATIMFAFSCKSDVINPEAELISTDSIAEIPAPTLDDVAPKPEGQQVYKVNIGVKPDVSHKGNGFKVAEVIEGRAGAKAGIKAGDLILELDGMAVPGLSQYTMYMSQFKSGEFVEMTIIRGDENIKTKVYFD